MNSINVLYFIADKITLEYRKDENEEYQEVPLNNTGIAWESDKKYKFKNPPELGDSPTPEEWEDCKHIFFLYLLIQYS